MLSKRDLQGLLRAAPSVLRTGGQQQKIRDMLGLVAANGGAVQFAEALNLMIKYDLKINVATFHEFLTALTLRVPTPVAMVRVALNLAIQRPEDIIPLTPAFKDDADMRDLFQGCQAPGAASSIDPELFEDLNASLAKVDLHELIGRVELSEGAAGFLDYYSHFIALLHLDFLEELRQKQKLWERPAPSLATSGHAALGLQPEPSYDGKLLILSASTAATLRIDAGAGKALLLSRSGEDVFAGGAMCFAQVRRAGPRSEFDPTLELVLDVGGKKKVQEMCKAGLLDSYTAVNVIAYERQLTALRYIAEKDNDKRFPLWELLPLSGVGGDILDSWAARMRSRIHQHEPDTPTKNNPPVSANGPDSSAPRNINVLKLQSLAMETPSMPRYRMDTLECYTDALAEGGRLHRDPDIARDLERLNESQRGAVAAALQRRLTVIQGPPGTGKTHVSVEVLRLWSRLGVRPILVTSHNNVAVDNIAESAYAKGMQVVRLGNADRMSPSPTLDACSLDSILDATCDDPTDKVARFLASKKVLRSAEVVCVTTTASATHLLSKIDFGAILMDEAAQTTELSALVPLAHVRAERLVLVGDHCQLPATALSLEAETRGLTLSLFQRLVSRGFPSVFLDTQFRMHPKIAEHSSRAFYESKLLSGVSPDMRPPPAGFAWPSASAGLAFIDTSHSVDCSEEKNGQSWCNPGEAVLITQILASVLSAGELQPSQIGVVTPYMGQVRTLRRVIRRYVDLQTPRDLLIASVDSYQGREKELILFSAVRRNHRGQVGFLADWRRLNVMITRARRGLVVVGNAKTLKADPFWKAYVLWAETEGYALEFNIPK